jgi:hypothetical protein
MADEESTSSTEAERMQAAYALRTYGGPYGIQLAAQLDDPTSATVGEQGTPDQLAQAAYALRTYGGEYGRSLAGTLKAELPQSDGPHQADDQGDDDKNLRSDD